MNRTCVQLKKTTSLYLNLTNLFVLKIKSFNNRCYNCWSCDRLLSNKESRSFFCPCEKQKILPSNIAGTSYFDLFSIDSNYDIDKKTLTKNFRQLMRKLHPDLYTQSSEKEKLYSAEQSSLVNKAYRVLSNPIQRGLYILEMNKVDFEAETVETGELNREKEALLMSVLELNERLNDINSIDQVAEFELELEKNLSPLENELNQAFKRADFKLTVEIISKMKYFKNVDERLQDLKLKFNLTQK